MKATYIYIGVLVLFVAVIAGAVYVKKSSPVVVTEVASAYDEFAQCLSDSGARFFGAFWCPHCKEQKEMLQNSKKLPYVECSTPDGNNQTKICIDENITGYPTWKFADDSVLDGVIELSVLSEKTNCPLPTL